MTGLWAGPRDGWGARAKALLAAFALVLAAGCATTGGNGSDPRDPFEGFNRSMFEFNDKFDEAIAKPVATAYKWALPDPVRGWVRNFFANVADVFIGVNNLLQGKPADAVNDWARFAFNTTLGLFGINDVASEAGLEKHNEDFGQTFGRWGVGSGAYLVWPFFGPSTVRDTAGSFIDAYVDPLWRHEPANERRWAWLFRITNQRADLLEASRIFEEAALDKYVFQRDAYLQRRRGLIHDGNPPRESPSSGLRGEPQSQAPGADRLFEEPAGGAGLQPEPVQGYAPRQPANYEAVLAASRETK